MTEAEEFRAPRDRHDEAYRNFQRQEGIPVHEGLFIEDVRTVPVEKWKRTGGRGAFINLDGMELVCDAQIHEISPGEALKPQRHLHEALIFVISGSGLTTIGTDEDQTTFEWDDDALFYVPHNTRYVHSNASGETPVRLLAVTSLPLLYTVFRTDEAIWEVEDYSQWPIIKQEDYYASVAELRTAADTRTYWDSNFVPDVVNFDQLASWSRRGEGNRSVFFPFVNTSMDSHISEFGACQYKKAHRHLSGANLLILSGEGYTLLWQEGDDEQIRIDWSPYTLFAPPTMYFHQHFNISDEQGRYVVFHGPQQQTGIQKGNDALNSLRPKNQIEYHEEDPSICRKFRHELAAKNLEDRMCPEVYDAPSESSH